jgi:hypothetical protein
VKRRLLLAAIAALTALLVAGVVAMAVFAAFTLGTVRETQLDSVQRAKDTERLAERIESCTTPGGQCFEASAARTRSAVGTINRITVYAAACADRAGVDTAPEIQHCIERALAAEDR